MLILVGLGNPEQKYLGNRHNLGFRAVDTIADRWSFAPPRKRFQSQAREGQIETPQGPIRALILKPQTFYNGSGNAVGEAVNFLKADPSDVVVFYDEIDLAPGRFRLKHGGGAAGNNGIRSITSQIGPHFRRGRMGVGHPGHKDRVMGHVLSDFHKVEQGWVEDLCRAVAEAMPLLAAGEDEKYQAEVMRLAPAEKMDPRAAARGED